MNNSLGVGAAGLSMAKPTGISLSQGHYRQQAISASSVLTSRPKRRLEGCRHGDGGGGIGNTGCGCTSEHEEPRQARCRARPPLPRRDCDRTAAKLYTSLAQCSNGSLGQSARSFRHGRFSLPGTSQVRISMQAQPEIRGIDGK